MSGKLLAFISVVWIVGLLMGSTFSYQNTPDTWTGSSTVNSLATGGYGQISDLEYLMNGNNAVQNISILGAITLPMPNPEYFKIILSMVTLRFSFLMGTPIGLLFWTIILLPFSIMAVASLIVLFVGMMRGNISW
jgi:hypothetical protein